MIEFFIATLIAAGIGVIAAVIGLGGGFLYVPTLALIFDVEPRTAIGTSLAVMIFATVSATLCYQRQGVIIHVAALILLIPSFIGSILGSFSTTLIPIPILVSLFSFALIILALEMLVPSLNIIRPLKLGPVLSFRVHTARNPNHEVRVAYLHLICWGFLGGFVSGVTGTSGGAYFVPALIAVGVPVHSAVATSLLTIIGTSIAGASTHLALGQISWTFVWPYGIGAAIGAAIGATIAEKIEPDHIKKSFGIILMGIALFMIKEKVIGI